MSSLQVRGGSRGDGWSLKHLVWGSIVKAPLPSLPAQGDRGLQGAVGENGEKVNAAWGALRALGGLEPDLAVTHSLSSGRTWSPWPSGTPGEPTDPNARAC